MDPFGLCAQRDDLGLGPSVTNLFHAWYQMIESGIAAAQLAILSFESPDLLPSLGVLAEALEGGATVAAEGAVAAESTVATERTVEQVTSQGTTVYRVWGGGAGALWDVMDYSGPSPCQQFS